MNRHSVFALSLTVLVAVFFIPEVHAQYITHGPVTGAVTANTCKVYARTSTASSIQLLVSNNENFTPVVTYHANTSSALDFSAIIQLSSLSSNTKYFLKVLVNGKEDAVRGSFRTFPATDEKGDFTFVTGSCQETENMKVFDAMPKCNPYFMMHTGDFTYPDYMIARNYADSHWGIDSSYRRRYNEKVMKEMLQTIPIDYVFDDDDYVGAGAGRYHINGFNSWREKGHIYYSMPADSFPPHWRRNVIKGYADYFPHYELPDTAEGIFHSFRFGNAEFFVLDRNSAKDYPDGACFKYDSLKRKWQFAPDSSLVLFGKKQMDWLKKSLLASTADWKFIVSGVPLNGACEKLIKAGVKIQQLHWKDWTGFQLALGFTRYWAGYPHERNDFMSFVKSNNLKNIIVISGDTHHSVMDDGTNAGLPEMNASGLSVATTELAKYLKLIGNGLGLYRWNNIWNKGGIGISSRECKNGFGKVRIVRNEFVEMSIVDEDNKTISTFQVPFQK
ncbi:MAG: alkaline phosphatase D family protein [Chitinophagales bacterium]|nr:alkaline phosphatase D family protein [Chitinophagales bacterium]